MKLSTWARQQGVCYRTALRLYHAGRIPLPTEQLDSGTILVHPAVLDAGSVAVYARVSGGDQKNDLDRQVARLVAYANESGLMVSVVVKEIGSGLNGHRKGLAKLLRDPKITTIVVEHKDRLARFGFEYIEATLASSGRRLLVVNSGDLQDDIVQDLHDVIVSMCARIYGKRAAANRAKRALVELT